MYLLVFPLTMHASDDNCPVWEGTGWFTGWDGAKHLSLSSVCTQ